MSATSRPDIFVSATSGDLDHIRLLAKEALLSIDCHPVEQKNFPPDYRSVEEMLRAKIAACDAVLHIVGIRYGAEPDPTSLPDGQTRLSYTQLEAQIARELGKKLYLFLCPDDFTYGDFPAEPGEQQALQQAYRARVSADKQLRTSIRDDNDVSLRVRELQTQIESLRHSVTTLEDSVKGTKISHTRLFVLSSLGFLLIGGGLWLGYQHFSEQTGSIIEGLKAQVFDPDAFEAHHTKRIQNESEAEIEAINNREDLKSDWVRRKELKDKAIAERDLRIDSLRSSMDVLRDGFASSEVSEYLVEYARIADSSEGIPGALAYFESITKEIIQEIDADYARLGKNLEKTRAKERVLLAAANNYITEERYDQAIKIFDILTLSRSGKPVWLEPYWNYADFLRSLGDRGDSTLSITRLQRASDLYREIIANFDGTTSPLDWAGAQNDLGNVLGNLGSRVPGESGTATLMEARDCFREALSIPGIEDSLRVRALFQTNLGNVLQDLVSRLPYEAGTTVIKEAKGAYLSALSCLAREENPVLWANAQNNLGNALNALGGRLRDPDGLNALEQARSAHLDALSVFTKDAFPLKWAVTKQNLGITLIDLATWQNGEEKTIILVNEAKENYTSSLSVLSREEFPQHWAMTQINLAKALSISGVLLPGIDGLEAFNSSTDAIFASMEIYTKEDLPLRWALAQNNLGMNFFLLSARNSGEEKVAALNDAKASYLEALSVFTEEDHPDEWATAQRYLGHVLYSLATYLPEDVGAIALKEARSAYLAALAVYTKDNRPEDWAQIQEVLAGLSYDALLYRDFGLAEHWARDAIAAVPSITAYVNLAHALLFQGKYDEAIALYGKNWDDSTRDSSGYSFREYAVADFEEMATRHLSHPDLSKLKNALGVDSAK